MIIYRPKTTQAHFLTIFGKNILMNFNSLNTFETKSLLAIAAILVSMVFSNSCANPGVGPSGGDRDSIPPEIIESVPQNYQRNFNGNEIILSFNEYIVADNLASNMIVSPPLAEKPLVRMKGKSLYVKFEEDLIPGRTYSVDFKDGIKDYTEGNKIESLRMLFSTYDQIDTLRISGYLLDAFTLEPVENAIAVLYTLADDSVFTSLKPDFIAKANSEGFFMFDNLPKGEFRLFGLVDNDRNLFFSDDKEIIAFSDTLIVPSASFVSQPDTVITQTDTLITEGYTQYLPDDVFAMMFTHHIYKQNLVYDKREDRDLFVLNFREPVSDSLKIDLLNNQIENPMYTEINQNNDSISIWLTDTTLINTDSLYLRVAYTVTDSANNFITKTDTLRMLYARTKNEKSKQNLDAEKQQVFKFESNIGSGAFDLNKKIELVSPIPLIDFSDEHITLEKAVNDTTFEAVNFTFNQRKNSKRKFIIDFGIEEDTRYRIVVDSAAVYSYSGKHNLLFEKKFKTQKTDFYGSYSINIEGLESLALVQLLKKSKSEDLVRQIVLEKGNTKVLFDYLKAGDYLLKIIVDRNSNKTWDTGNFSTNTQPEPVYYYHKILTVKSNWDLHEDWMIDTRQRSLKNIKEPQKE